MAVHIHILIDHWNQSVIINYLFQSCTFKRRFNLRINFIARDTFATVL